MVRVMYPLDRGLAAAVMLLLFILGAVTAVTMFVSGGYDVMASVLAKWWAWLP
jgi:hypothetical protein